MPIKPGGDAVRSSYATDEQDEADVIVDWIKRTFDALPSRGAGATSPCCTASTATAS